MTARHELDLICRETWNEFAGELKATSNSMGRIGLSCARRHPALLLGGGALLGFGATVFFTRGKKHVHARSPHADHGGVNASPEPRVEERENEPAKPSKVAHFATGALMHILKNATRMWLLEHLSNHLHDEPQVEEGENELDVPTETAA